MRLLPSLPPLLASLIAACAGSTAYQHPSYPAITEIGVAFVSDRPTLPTHERSLGQAAASDIVLLKVDLFNPLSDRCNATLACESSDVEAKPVRQRVVLQPKSGQRVTVPGFMAQVVPITVRCRLELDHAASSPQRWVDIRIPANDQDLPPPR